jgi:hypothetical protein
LEKSGFDVFDTGVDLLLRDGHPEHFALCQHRFYRTAPHRDGLGVLREDTDVLPQLRVTLNHAAAPSVSVAPPLPRLTTVAGQRRGVLAWSCCGLGGEEGSNGGEKRLLDGIKMLCIFIAVASVKQSVRFGKLHSARQQHSLGVTHLLAFVSDHASS